VTSTRAYKALVLVIAATQLVLASVIDPNTAPVLGLGPVAVKVIGIVSAVLTLVANGLPSIFAREGQP
jgi:hypothetical protein